MLTFDDSGLREELLKAVGEIGFVEPTPIQQQAIPHILTSDRDLIAFAQTGTGKTAAFGLPSLHRTDTSSKVTQTLVLCPTRELCLQITRDLQGFAKYLKGLHVTAVYGGSSIETQIKALKRGSQIVVGTPGRTLDLIKRRRLDLRQIKTVVLDEADEMLSMGFKEDLEAILSQTPDDKQVLLFSATMADSMKSMTREMKNPERISVAAKNKGADTVRHVYYMVNARDRYEALKRITDVHPSIYAIIFCRTRRDTKEVANRFMADGYNADAIHGDLSQSQRDEVMGKFRKRQLQLLIATDVAARGLDVNDLTHVINYNLPDEIQNYVHRSGRTGRAGKKGVSIAIVHSREGRKIRDIERSAGIRFQRETVPTGREVCQKQLIALVDKIENVEVDESQIGPFMPEIYDKLQWLDREQLIKHFVSAEFNRFLSYYKGARDLNISDKRDDTRKGKRSKAFVRLFVNLGSKNNLNPKHLIGLLNSAMPNDRVRLGKIDIEKSFAFFEVEQGMEMAVLTALNGKEFSGKTVHAEITESKPTPEHAFVPERSKKKSRGRAPKAKRSKHRKGGRRKF